MLVNEDVIGNPHYRIEVADELLRWRRAVRHYLGKRFDEVITDVQVEKFLEDMEKYDETIG